MGLWSKVGRELDPNLDERRCSVTDDLIEAAVVLLAVQLIGTSKFSLSLGGLSRTEMIGLNAPGASC